MIMSVDAILLEVRAGEGMVVQGDAWIGQVHSQASFAMQFSYWRVPSPWDLIAGEEKAQLEKFREKVFARVKQVKVGVPCQVDRP